VSSNPKWAEDFVAIYHCAAIAKQEVKQCRRLATVGHRVRISLLKALKMETLAVSLIVAGMAFLFCGLFFLLPIQETITAKQRSVDQSLHKIEYYLREFRRVSPANRQIDP
jgi:hypothetical protein